MYNLNIDVFLPLFTLLYADDTIILAESETELQKSLDAVHTYCSTMKLTVNTQKTKVMIFSRGKVRKYQDFYFGDCMLDVSCEYLYLGIMFSYNCLFNKAILRHITQTKRAMFALITKGRRLSLPLDVLFELFDKLIIPIITYGSEVIGINNIEKLEIFQRSFF